MSIEIPKYNIDELLNELKPYQRNELEKLLKSNNPIDAAKIWLSAKGADTTIAFGGKKDSHKLWDNFIVEFNKFICDDEEYTDNKNDIKKEMPISKELLISIISSSIATQLGYPAIFISPAVVLVLFTVGKMTKNAYCATYYLNDPKKI